MIITIDGPAASGKSTTARAVAERLGFRHLDSGAFYRALTYAALRAGIEPERWDTLEPERLETLQVHAEPDETGFDIYVGGRNVSAELRSAEVTRHVSQMARVPTVREWLLERLREAAHGVDLVTDGRDMGTVVFPDADLKIYLTADPAERARRRLVQDGNPAPDAATIEAEARRLVERDRMDSERAVAPLRKPADAVHLDTTDLSFDEQVDRIVQLATARRASLGAERR